MTSTAVRHSNMHATALKVYNLPSNVAERDVRSVFPSAQHVRMSRQDNESNASQSMCTVHFDSPHECQKVYAECQSGKTVGGRMLHVEFGSDWGASGNGTSHKHESNEAPRWSGQSATYDATFSNDNYRSNQASEEDAPFNQSLSHRQRDATQGDEYQRRNSGSERYTGSDRYVQPRTGVPRSMSQRSDKTESVSPGCTLTVSNLPYSATEADIKREFVNAFQVILNLNDHGQSRGVAQVTFSTPEQCNAALHACNQKTMNGRTLRGRIQRDDDNGQSNYNSRDINAHQSGGRRETDGGQRHYNDRQREYGNSRGDYAGTQRGSYGNRGFGGNREYGSRGGTSQFRDDGNRRGGGGGRVNDYNHGRFDRDNRHPGGGNGQQGFRQGQRENRDDRRERSPNRGEPVRGYGGGKGPRITSAVIRGTHERSSSSESSGSEN